VTFEDVKMLLLAGRGITIVGYSDIMLIARGSPLAPAEGQTAAEAIRRFFTRSSWPAPRVAVSQTRQWRRSKTSLAGTTPDSTSAKQSFTSSNRRV